MFKSLVVSICLLSAANGARAWADEDPAATRPVPMRGERVAEYLDRWDAWLETIPEDQDAMGLIDDVCRVIDEQAGNQYYLMSGPSEDEYDQADWGWTVEFIEDYQQALWKARSLARRSVVGVDLRHSSMLYGRLGDEGYAVEPTATPKFFEDILPDHWSQMRKISMLLIADLYIANEAGQIDRVLWDLRALVGMAELCQTTGATIDFLVAGAIDNLILGRLLRDELDLDGFSSAQLEELGLLLTQIEGRYDPRLFLKIERISVIDFVEWIYEDSVDGRISPLGLARYIDSRSPLSFADLQDMPYSLLNFGSEPSAWDVVGDLLAAMVLSRHLKTKEEQIRFANQSFDDLLSIWDQPIRMLETWPMDRLDEDSSEGFLLILEYGPVLEFTESFGNVLGTKLNHDLDLHAASLLVALHAHKLRHGAFPDRVENIEADLVRASFVDAMSGDTLRYRLVDGQPMIYSVGTDRDDDGGSEMIGESRSWLRFYPLDELAEINKNNPASIDGDWILYPRPE